MPLHSSLVTRVKLHRKKKKKKKKKGIKRRMEKDELEVRKTTEEINKIKSWFFESLRKHYICNSIKESKTFRNKFEEVKDCYAEDNKTLMKILKNTHMNGRTSHVHGLEKLIFLKCPYY